MDARKLHESMTAALEDITTEEAAPMPIIVRLRPGLRVDSPDVVSLMQTVATPVRYQYRLIPALATTATPEQISAITRNPAVDLIWPDLPVHTMLDVSVPLIRAPRVWDAGFTGQGVRVAIVDTGIDLEHPDFQGRIADVTDFTGEGPDDNNGHGTHVASIAAGSGAASDGKYRGVAPGVTILAAKVLRANGSGTQSDVMAGMEWAIQNGAQVINLSLGGPPAPCDGTDALSELVDAAVEAGAVVCVAAGNSGPGPETIGSPGCARRAITVGATESDPTNEFDRVARFSSRGPTADGRVKPDLAFPGVGIIAARAGGTSPGTIINDHYASLSGTSMATPHATGVAALLLSANPNLDPEQVKRRMMAGARSMQLERNAQGSGRGDAYNAFLDQTGEPLPAPPPEEPGGCLVALLGGLRR